MTWYGDAGLNYKGLFASRDEDTLGLAYSHTELSHKPVDDSGRALRSHHEDVLEMTYEVVCSTHVSIQPDLQFIFNPGATEQARTAIVSGVRLNLEF